MRALKLQTSPASEPITTAEAKTHLRVEHSDDDTYIAGLITSARQYLEAVKRRAFVTQTWDLWLDGWPDTDVIDLPRPPLVSVTSIVYYDSAHVEATFAAADYHVDVDAEPGRIILDSDASWPSVTLRPAHAVRVRYVAGYGAASAVPESVKSQLKILVADAYESRESIVTGTIVSENPGLRRLLHHDRSPAVL